MFAAKGAPWTILCMEMQGPYRMENIAKIAETLANSSGIKGSDVYYVDGDDQTARLYYGVYHRKTDPKTGMRPVPRKLQRDLKRIKLLGTGPGQYYFLRARMVRLPTANVGNPAWNLENASGTYTLQVGVFEPTDEFWNFKEGAAELCALLRDKGYEAYYYHTEGSSIVTVGTFGPNAVISSRRGFPKYSAGVVALQQSDDLLKYNRLNGVIYKAKTDKGTMARVPSRLVHMPNSRSASSWQN